MPATSRRGWHPRGLRWRLAAWVVGMLVVSAAATFVVVYVNTGTELQREIDRDLTDDTTQLQRELQSFAHAPTSTVVLAARRFVRGQPYTATSTLFFLLVPGGPNVSNHPDVFTDTLEGPQDHDDHPALEAAQRTGLSRPRPGLSTRIVPDVGKVRILERIVHLSGRRMVLGAGEPLADVARAQHGIARAYVLAGALAIVFALIASYFAGARVSAPLRRMAAVAARVDAGDLEPRMELAPASGEEVHVLADAFNGMLDRLSEAFEGQRAFVADASHELRTPLTVIRGQLELLAAETNPSSEEVHRVERLVQEEIARVSRLVDDLLLLAQAEQHNFLRPERIELDTYVDDLWDGLSLTAKRRFEVGRVPPGMLTADPDRLAQALRNLGNNAVAHTAEGTGLVRLDVSTRPGGVVVFAVVDDGPGIPAAERDRIFERFHRTDLGRARDAGGAGLGLAIVRAIAEAHGGSVAAGEGPDGRGARIELSLPGYSPNSA
jgi:two-component system, OmpR family, sensor kinase